MTNLEKLRNALNEGVAVTRVGGLLRLNSMVFVFGVGLKQFSQCVYQKIKNFASIIYLKFIVFKKVCSNLKQLKKIHPTKTG